MALIVITINDSDEGAQVGVLAEPGVPKDGSPLTPAQGAALQMLAVLQSEIKQDRGLIELIN